MSAEDIQANLLVTKPDRADSYRLQFARTDERQRFDLAMNEAAGGLVATLAAQTGVHVPAQLGAWRLDASAEGPPAALALSAVLDAGPLQASADLPAMAIKSSNVPNAWPTLACRRIRLSADLHGPMQLPRWSARIELDGFSAGDMAIERLAVTTEGDIAGLRFDGELSGMRPQWRWPN